MNKYMIINDQNNFQHIWSELCYYTVIIKFLLFPEDYASSGLSQDPSHIFFFIKYGNIYTLESILLFTLFKTKIRLLENDQKCLRHGSSTKPLLSHCKRDNTTKKISF